MRNCNFLFLLTMLAAWTGKSANAAEIDVISWALTTRVDVAGLGIDTDGTNIVVNGLQSEHFASLGGSTSYTAISADWDAAGFFEFMLDAEHNCEGGADVKCRSSGNIVFTPLVDSNLDFTGIYDYEMGNGTRTARLAVSLFTLDPMSTVINSTRTRNTLVHPPTGQIAFQSPLTLLDAGRSYIINYNLELNSFSGSPANLSRADGSLRLAINPIPEPITFLLIAATAPALLKRARSPLDLTKPNSSVARR